MHSLDSLAAQARAKPEPPTKPSRDAHNGRSHGHLFSTTLFSCASRSHFCASYGSLPPRTHLSRTRQCVPPLFVLGLISSSALATPARLKVKAPRAQQSKSRWHLRTSSVHPTAPEPAWFGAWSNDVNSRWRGTELSFRDGRANTRSPPRVSDGLNSQRR
ncbi:hypothetical protein F5148DRAFT_386465 [Russula earlei]|uniref:Uncharacterized protein n=1 Tax=Russula earlei TaxID=71964 RepID=A0ACC0U1U7_9AGAM|nr:hypothetical protein F5148DRAFT_386465 [Russula earlei]